MEEAVYAQFERISERGGVLGGLIDEALVDERKPCPNRSGVDGRAPIETLPEQLQAHRDANERRVDGDRLQRHLLLPGRPEPERLNSTCTRREKQTPLSRGAIRLRLPFGDRRPALNASSDSDYARRYVNPAIGPPTLEGQDARPLRDPRTARFGRNG